MHFLQKAHHDLLVLGTSDSTLLGSHFKQNNHQAKAQKCERHGTKKAAGRTLVQCELKQEGSVASFSLSWKRVHRMTLRVLKWWQKGRQYQYHGHKYISASRQICNNRICRWWELTLGRIDFGFGKTSALVLPCCVWSLTTCPLLHPLLTPSLFCSLNSFQSIYPTKFSAPL